MRYIFKSWNALEIAYGNEDTGCTHSVTMVDKDVEQNINCKRNRQTYVCCYMMSVGAKGQFKAKEGVALEIDNEDIGCSQGVTV